MNFILISPHFPVNFKPFAYALKEKGVNVLGIGDTPYENLGTKLQTALTEYYRVDDLENTEAVKRAVALLYFKHGKIDRIESHNEHWLELDAELREEFNVPGVRPAELRKTKYKSEMKKVFTQAGVPVAEGYVANSTADIREIVETLALPVVAKPDKGVGSAATYMLRNEEDVNRFIERFDERVPYFIEKAIESRRLGTYDGLLDSDGNIVFETSLIYNQPTLEFMDGETDVAYYIQKELDPKLIAYGQNIVKAFGMKERFFHIEFFKMPDGDYIALEYNNRLAGNYAVDLYNIAHSIDLFQEYANIVTRQPFHGNPNADKQFCMGTTHRDLYTYAHDAEAIRARFGDRVKISERMPEAFAELMGDTFYAITADTEEELDDVIEFVHKRTD